VDGARFLFHAGERTLLTNASILITGGTGSFGQSFVRYLLDTHYPRRVCVYSRDEWKQAVMMQEFQDARLRFFIGDVRDRDRLEQAMGGVEYVVHAAALKRVDAIAYNPTEVLKTNVMGTQAVIEACVAAGVKRMVLISSDKACQPTNVYGASKQMAEHLTVFANSWTAPKGTTCVAVRYGNVMASRGSVVHLFRQYAQTGEALPITHPDMTRFWLPMRSAHEIVEYALTELEAGEILIPKLPSIRLPDLAEAIAPGHATVTVGLRPGGEKLHERLLSEEEPTRTVDVGKYYVVIPQPHPWTSTVRSGAYLHPSFTYTSDQNTQWLDVTTLRTMLQGVP